MIEQVSEMSDCVVAQSVNSYASIVLLEQHKLGATFEVRRDKQVVENKYEIVALKPVLIDFFFGHKL